MSNIDISNIIYKNVRYDMLTFRTGGGNSASATFTFTPTQEITIYSLFLVGGGDSGDKNTGNRGGDGGDGGKIRQYTGSPVKIKNTDIITLTVGSPNESNNNNNNYTSFKLKNNVINLSTLYGDDFAEGGDHNHEGDNGSLYAYTNLYYGGGGGGGGNKNPEEGGKGGGGKGGEKGQDNFGGGGGGGTTSGIPPGKGGSGVVIMIYTK